MTEVELLTDIKIEIIELKNEVIALNTKEELNAVKFDELVNVIPFIIIILIFLNLFKGFIANSRNSRR